MMNRHSSASSGGVSIDYRFDGTKATVTTHTNEDSVTIGDHERGSPVLVSPTKKTYTLDKFAYIDELVPVHMVRADSGPHCSESRERSGGRCGGAIEHRDSHSVAGQH